MLDEIKDISEYLFKNVNFRELRTHIQKRTMVANLYPNLTFIEQERVLERIRFLELDFKSEHRMFFDEINELRKELKELKENINRDYVKKEDIRFGWLLKRQKERKKKINYFPEGGIIPRIIPTRCKE